jgi:hypothetical protein
VLDPDHLELLQAQGGGFMPRTGTVPDADDGPNDDVAAPTPSAAAKAADPVAGQPPAAPMGLPSVPEQWAAHLRNSIPALFMFASLKKPFGEIDEKAYRIYRDRLLADCGSPTDPIEAMVLEQLALAHFNLGLLHCKAANAGHVAATAAYSAAASRLMAEFRCSSLGLQAYRAAARQLAHDPTKDLIIPDGELASNDDQPGKNGPDDELIATEEARDAGEPILPYPRPAALGDQPPQPAEMAHEPRGKGKGPRRRAAT